MQTHQCVSDFRHILAGVAVSLLIYSCGPVYTTPPVSPQLIKVSRTPTSRLERGYVVHQAKCAKCHPFENPADYEVDELSDNILPTMARKSKINMEDQQAVLAYLLAVRKLPAPVAEHVTTP